MAISEEVIAENYIAVGGDNGASEPLDVLKGQCLLSAAVLAAGEHAREYVQIPRSPPAEGAQENHVIGHVSRVFTKDPPMFPIQLCIQLCEMLVERPKVVEDQYERGAFRIAVPRHR